MGQFEKIVVLLAFFLVTLILVVTFKEDPEDVLLSMEDHEVAAAGPSGAGSLQLDQPAGQAQPMLVPSLEPAQDQEAGQQAPRSLQESLRQEQEQARREQESPADLFLDDNFSMRPAQPGALPEGSALITVEGLRRSWDDSIMEYDWQRGDNWVILARRLYGDQNMSELLRQFNEGSTYVAPGSTVQIPVYDRREKATREARGEQKLGTSHAELSEERGTLYKVVDGDSLWVIAKKVYGKGHLWKDIYEANTDVLESPESVKPGMGLRIP